MSNLEAAKASRMSARPPIRQAPRASPAGDRNASPAAPDKRGSLRWVRDVLARSMRLEPARSPAAAPASDAGRPAVVAASPALLVQQRADLGARLLVHDPATQPVRHLFILHDELRARGWAGVEALPPKVLSRALTEAEILDSHEPSPLLTGIIENLRSLTLAADVRAADAAIEREWETLQVPEVSDTNFDEYELMERSWAGTVPAGLELPRRSV
jgi:hypothetical protein